MKLVLGVAALVLCVLASVNAAKLDKPSSYIINGEDVAEAIPYYAYLEIYELLGLQGNIFFGGATLITPTAVLTVAQNILEFGSWRIGVGGTRIQDLVWYTVASAHPHPDYNTETLGDNIGVLILTGPVTITPSVNVILRIGETSLFPIQGQNLYIFGFGFGVIDEQPNILQEAQLTVLSDADCGAAYPHLVASGQLVNYFCAGNPTARSNICAGDQGGPIVERTFPFLMGLQSFNRIAECGDLQSQPAAFIRVNRYTQFIDGIIAAHSNI